MQKHIGLINHNPPPPPLKSNRQRKQKEVRKMCIKYKRVALFLKKKTRENTPRNVKEKKISSSSF